MVQKQADGNGTRVDERKREILLAASEAFREHGFHATGMREIAGALGMTVGNLYYYFKNKQELLAYCQHDAVQRLLALAEWVNAQDLRADTRLFLLVVGQVVCLNEGTPGSLAHMEVEALDAEWRPKITELRKRFEAVIRDVIQGGIAQGVFLSRDPKVATFATLGAGNWTVKWFRRAGELSAREIGDQFAEQLVRGLLAPGVELVFPEVELPDV